MSILPLGQFYSWSLMLITSFSVLTAILPLVLADFTSNLVFSFLSFNPMSQYGSQSPNTTSPGTAEDTSREQVAEQVQPPMGILELQSLVVSKCSKWIDKFKSGIIKKSKASFKIHSIFASTGQKAEVVKAAIESYLSILDQHEAKTVAAFKRGKPGPRGQKSHNSSRSSS